MNLTQRCQRVSQPNPQIDRNARPFLIRQLIGSDKCVFQMFRGYPIRRARNGSGRRGLQMDDCAIPYLGPKACNASHSVFSYTLVGKQFLPGNQSGAVQRPSSVRRQRLISDIRDQGMLECVLAVRIQPGLEQKFGGLQTFQSLLNLLRRTLADRLENAERYRVSCHGSTLKKALVGRNQAINP